MALRAGVPVADVEFVQFHPTALHGPIAGPRPLLSEALRGEGALLRSNGGRRFVDEMQPRDVVAAAVAAEMSEDGVDHVWLDVSGVAEFEKRFPTLAASVRELGLEPGTDWIPVAPAAHYLCGGVVTDLDGATALPGLWAAGEVACTGVHGANRLASNSLLEGMVFGARVIDAVLRGREGPEATGALLPVLRPGEIGPGGLGAVRLNPVRLNPVRPNPVRLNPVRLNPADLEPVAGAGPRGTFGSSHPEVFAMPAGDPGRAPDARIATVQRAMTVGAGVVRSAESLERARSVLDDILVETPADLATEGELANLALVGKALVSSALARRETRGGHRRSDFPETSQAFSHRFVQ